MKETMTSPFNTAMPDKAMKPTPAEIENGMPRRDSASTPPVSASGTPEKMTAASRKEPSATISSATIRTRVNGTTISRRRAADSSCSNVPPYSTQ